MFVRSPRVNRPGLPKVVMGCLQLPAHTALLACQGPPAGIGLLPANRLDNTLLEESLRRFHRPQARDVDLLVRRHGDLHRTYPRHDLHVWPTDHSKRIPSVRIRNFLRPVQRSHPIDYRGVRLAPGHLLAIVRRLFLQSSEDHPCEFHPPPPWDLFNNAPGLSIGSEPNPAL